LLLQGLRCRVREVYIRDGVVFAQIKPEIAVDVLAVRLERSSTELREFRTLRGIFVGLFKRIQWFSRLPCWVRD
jgi:hypothetical protein